MRPSLFTEDCAGAAAVTLRLLGGPRLDPPVSWMGGKRRHASTILAMMGLRSGLGADRVLLCDPGPWGWAWPVLLDPDGCRAVAAIVRGWAGRDPRQLWTELRDAGPPEDLQERVAAWLVLQIGNALGKPVEAGGTRWKTSGYAHLSHAARAAGFTERLHPGLVAERIASLEGVRASVTVHHGSALDTLTDTLPPNTYCYLDPPYRGRTGYGWDMPREQVVELARSRSDAGAFVMVSEAEPVEELTALGWEAHEITAAGRCGAGPEWVTSNRPVRARVAVQVGLFA